MIKPLQNIIGPFSKPVKITALTRMIPRNRRNVETIDRNFYGIVQLTPEMLELLGIDEESYVVPRTEFKNIVEKKDIDDWSYLLKRFDLLLNNLIKFLGNIRRYNYHKILLSKLDQKEIEERHNKLHEKLLEKEEDKKVVAKSKLTDKEKLDNLINGLIALGFAQGLVSTNYEDLSGLATGPVHKRGAQLAKMLMQKYGLKDFQAAAMVGNFIYESGLIAYNVENTSPYDAEEPLPPPWGTPRTGYGWAQWTGGRLNVFIEKFLGGGPNKRGRAATTDDNWKMLTYELDGPYKSVIDGLKTQTNVTDATIYAELNYEGALIKANDKRIAAAKGVLKELRSPTATKAKGGIMIPEIFKKHTIQYDTVNKTNILSNFIVDRPTIINVAQYNEPLIIIPIKRPIGISILKTLFERPFRRIEQMFFANQRRLNRKKPSIYKKSDSVTNRTNRNIIAKSQTNVGSVSPSFLSSKSTKTLQSSIKNKIETDFTSSKQSDNKISNTIPRFNSTPPSDMSKKQNFNMISQETEDVFGQDIILLTQDIIVTE